MALLQKQSVSGTLSGEDVLQALYEGLAGKFSGQNVLVLVPDHTRSLPLPFLFRALAGVLQDTRKLDFMVALGTHPAVDEMHMGQLFGITPQEREQQYANIGFYNHDWNNPKTLQTIGIIPQDQLRQIAGAYWHPSIGGDVVVRVNSAVFNYDNILILGPTFPHEVVGFSGGVKYLFPGISGPEMIHATHWLGALAGVVRTIGVKDTPIRAMIHAAADKLTVPVTLVGCVVVGESLAGVFIGEHREAWAAAADLSAQRHIKWLDRPVQRALSCPARRYDELWTAAKAMYKIEPAMAAGGEVIIYAPLLDTVSRVHGRYIYQVGYHTLDYFLQNWDHYQHVPLGVLAHSTHVRGAGVMENGVEVPNLRVTLASKIPPEDCKQLNLGYLDPARIRIPEWQDRLAEGILYVPKAGEILYRVKQDQV